MLVDDPSAGTIDLHHLKTRTAQGHYVSDTDAGYGLDIYTLRTAATRLGRAVIPLKPDQEHALRNPHGNLAADASIIDVAQIAPTSLSLGILCRAEDVADVLDRNAEHSAWAREMVVLADAPAAPASIISDSKFGKMVVRLVSRPLAGDFAAQRNALRAEASCAWQIQLDADEAFPVSQGENLARFASLADRQGVVSIGLPRRNLVDGVLSTLYPDTQYRLNRREVRFAGSVHERPVRPWQKSFIALNAAIDHHLTRSHVLARSKHYEALAPGEGRLDEMRTLLEPYRA
ncbi:hypothetical protein GCM10016234_28030 [Tianweitania populi]|uniref:Uncharacterized protein n=1 Tax=Tianweitania populi TaxID=1607949 RepID=A0A8J3GLF4_9HYPH|nr:hypothetical protein GCM10016234_28030 [Tianweitania populi]